MPIYKLGDKQPTIDPTAWVAETAVLSADVRLGKGVSVWWNAVIRGDTDTISIGDGSNIQDNSILHTDKGVKLNVGVNVVVGHSVILHGCTIGDNSLVGMGSIIMNNAVIGKNCIVGAGSLVPEGKVYPDGVMLLGRPAKVMRELTAEEIAGITKSAAHYVAYGQRYAAECVRID